MFLVKGASRTIIHQAFDANVETLPDGSKALVLMLPDGDFSKGEAHVFIFGDDARHGLARDLRGVDVASPAEATVETRRNGPGT